MNATLSSRVAELERQNRALRTTIVLALLAFVTCGGGGITSNFERVNTNVLVIRTAQDQPRITLDQNGAITFHRAEGDVVLDGDAVARLLSAAPTP